MIWGAPESHSCAAGVTGDAKTFSGGSAAAHDAMSSLIGESIASSADAVDDSVDNAVADAVEAPAAAPADDAPGLNWKDEWDKDPSEREPAPAPAAGADPFAPYRRGKGIALEVPPQVTVDEQALADFGRAATYTGFTPDLAQTLVDEAIGGLHRERALTNDEGSYDPRRTITELRFEFGESLEENLGAVAKFVNQRPALAAYLDSTGLGSSPTVLRLLIGIAKDTSILNAAGARRFIEKHMGDPKSPYWSGDKSLLAQMRIAHVVTRRDE